MRKAKKYRKSLEKLVGKRARFTAVLRRRNRRLRRIILVDIHSSETGKQVADHVWFREGQWSSYIPPRSLIAFDARVVPYVKGPDSIKFLDFRLERPTRVQIISRRTSPSPNFPRP